MATYEFHVSRKARQQYQFDEELFSTDGRAVVANFEAARRFAAKLSAGRPARCRLPTSTPWACSTRSCTS
jgi:hypothetical protein